MFKYVGRWKIERNIDRWIDYRKSGLYCGITWTVKREEINW